MRVKDIPKTIWINDSLWKIRFVRIVDNDPKFMGCCNFETKEICIKVGLSREDRALTFIHEVMHALEFEYDLPIDHSLIYRLEKPIYNLFCDNFANSVK